VLTTVVAPPLVVLRLAVCAAGALVLGVGEGVGVGEGLLPLAAAQVYVVAPGDVWVQV
jgi:hypothetical protein